MSCGVDIEITNRQGHRVYSELFRDMKEQYGTDKAEELYEYVYSDNFINKFGDFTDQDEAVNYSKLDFNGEPQLSEVITKLSGFNKNAERTYAITKDGLSELESKVNNFLADNGISVNTENIKKRFNVDANGLADITNNAIYLAKGESYFSDLAEETSHFYVESLNGTEELDKLLNTVDETDTYESVKENYSQLYQGDETMLRKEAAAKLIRDSIMEENLPKGRIRGLIRNIMKRIRQFFGKLSPIELGKETILQGKSINTDGEGRFYSYDKKNEISNSIKNSAKEVSQKGAEDVIFGDENINPETGFINKYVLSDGTELQKVVNYKPVKKQEKILGGRLKLQEHKSKPKQKAIQNFNVDLHRASYEILNRLSENKDVSDLASKYNKKGINNEQFNLLVKGLNNLMLQAKGIQEEIDSSVEPEFYFGTPVYDKERGIAGTPDIMTVYSDGTMSVYDISFIEGRKNPHKDTGKYFSTRDMVKQDQLFEMESKMENYKSILSNSYGVPGFRQTRSIPASLTLNRWKNPNKEVAYELGGLEIGDNISQIPLAKEYSSVKEINNTLDKLYKERALLEERLSKTQNESQVERYKTKLNRINKSIDDILVEGDIERSIEDFEDTLRRVRNNLEEEIQKAVPNDTGENILPNYNEKIRVIREYQDLINVYSTLALDSKNLVDRIQDEEKRESINKKLKNIPAQREEAQRKLSEKTKQFLSEIANHLEIKDFDQPSAEINKLFSWFQHFSTFSQSEIQALHKIVQDMHESAQKKEFELHEEIKKHQENIIDWAKKKGINKGKAFDMIIDDKTGNLISEYSDEFWKAKRNAINSKDFKWLRENLEPTLSKEEMEKKKQEAFNKIDQAYPVDSESPVDNKEINEYRKKQWVKDNDLYNTNTAWYNTHMQKYLKPKNPEKWYSSAYKELLKEENKPLYDFYNFYQEKMGEFMDILGTKKINKYTIPSIQSTVAEYYSRQGVLGWFKAIVGKGKSNLFEAIEVHDHDPQYGVMDPEGHKTKEVPTYYTHNMDPDIKSRELGRSLLKFAQMAYGYQEAVQTSEIAEAMVDLTDPRINPNVKQKVRDNSGNLIPDPSTPSGYKEITGDETSGRSTTDIMRRFVNFYWYGQRYQNGFLPSWTSEKEDDEGNKKRHTYSSDKLLLMMKQMMSVQTLGYNPVIAGTAYLASKTSSGIEAAKGRYYTSKQLRAADKLWVTDHKKYQAFHNLFEVDQDDIIRRYANGLSMSFSGKYLTPSGVLSWIRKADESQENRIKIAMMMNHGIDTDGKVKRMGMLSDNADKTSLYDRAYIDENGTVRFKGIESKEEYEKLISTMRRRMRTVAASVRGQQSQQDIYPANTTVLGSLVSQFRSWLPALFEERVGGLRYDANLEEYRLGRYRVAASELFRGLKPRVSEFLSLLGEVVSMGLHKRPTTDLNKIKGARKERAKLFLRKMREKGHFRGKSDEEAFKEYIELRQGQMRALAAEVRMIAVLTGAYYAATSLADDESVLGGSEVARMASKIFSRAEQELRFFYSPTETINLFSNAVPVSGFISNMLNIMTNTADELRDETLGDNNPYDKSGWGHYSSKAIPGFGTIYNITLADKLGSQN